MSIHTSNAPQLNEQISMNAARPSNSCHRCGAISYRQVIARDETGVMRNSGFYLCTQCKFEFSDVKAWRDGPSTTGGQENNEAQMSTVPAGTVNHLSTD